MKKISELLTPTTNTFPVVGQDGYGGEQDGTHACFSDVLRFKSKASADKEFPSGVPNYVKVHRCEYIPGSGDWCGWQVVFGWWSDQPEEGDGNPFCAY
jgi:hypothetical protein